MAYDIYLSERIQRILHEKHIVFEEKKMMGGLCFMVDQKMCVGVVKDELMVRIDPDIQQELLKKRESREMDFTGKPMKGYVFVSPVGIDKKDDLQFWLQKALDFNPKAKASLKKSNQKT